MNPELLRNLWLEITPQRLAAMPAVLFLIMSAVLISNGRLALPDAALWTGLAIGVVWGSRQAAGAVMGEVAARTWDSQRASALTPAQMALGKLFGATAYAWYGVVLCALIHLGAGGPPMETAWIILRTGLSHGVALFASLVLLGLGGRSLVMTSLPHLAGIVSVVAADGIVLLITTITQSSTIPQSVVEGMGASATTTGLFWFGLSLTSRGAARLFAALFWGWSVVGCIALLRGELNVPRRLPVWPLFIGFVALYTAGFGWNAGSRVTITLAFLALCLVTSVAALLEPKSRTEIRRLLAGAVGAIPPSLQALLAATMLAIALGAGVGADAARVARLEILHAFGAVHAFATVLFLARDIALVRLVSLRRGGLRGAVAAIVWIAVLYGILPAVLAGAGAEAALVLLHPMASEERPASAALSLGAPAAQAVLLWALLAWAVRRSAAAAAPQRG